MLRATECFCTAFPRPLGCIASFHALRLRRLFHVFPYAGALRDLFTTLVGAQAPLSPPPRVARGGRWLHVTSSWEATPATGITSSVLAEVAPPATPLTTTATQQHQPQKGWRSDVSIILLGWSVTLVGPSQYPRYTSAVKDGTAQATHKAALHQPRTRSAPNMVAELRGPRLFRCAADE